MIENNKITHRIVQDGQMRFCEHCGAPTNLERGIVYDGYFSSVGFACVDLAADESQVLL